QLLADLPQPRPVELGRDHGLLVGRLREDDPPRVDDQRAAVARLPGPRLADLAWSGDVVLVLDRPRAHEDVPVVAPGRHREGRRHGPWLRAQPAIASTVSPPSSGSAAAWSTSASPIAFHFSGRTTTSAPVEAARATSFSAFSRFGPFSGPLVIWTQATRRRPDTRAG